MNLVEVIAVCWGGLLVLLVTVFALNARRVRINRHNQSVRKG